MAGNYPVSALFTDLANRSTKIAADTQLAAPGWAQGSPHKLLDWLLLRGDRKRTTASAIVCLWAAFKDRFHRVHPPFSYLGPHGSNQLEDISLRRCLLILWRLLSRRLDLAAPEAFTGQHESLCGLRVALPLHAQHRGPAGLHSCNRGVLWEGAGSDGMCIQFLRGPCLLRRHSTPRRPAPSG